MVNGRGYDALDPTRDFVLFMSGTGAGWPNAGEEKAAFFRDCASEKEAR
jgi:hypothetical protein